MGLLQKVSLGFVAIVLITAAGVGAWLFLYTGDLPKTEQLSEFTPTTAHLATHSCLAGLSFAVPFDRIGKPFKDALNSAEPSSSYLYQVARTLMCNKRDSPARYQLDVFRLSWHIRERFSEQELFTIYANTAYFGPAATGVENASRHLFQKGADALSPEEAALLAGLLRAPSIFSPFKNAEKALQRRNKILEAMAVQGKLSAIELATAVTSVGAVAELVGRLIVVPDAAGGVVRGSMEVVLPIFVVGGRIHRFRWSGSSEHPEEVLTAG